jgi:hypothetical protein
MFGAGRQDVLEQINNSTLWDKLVSNGIDKKVDSIWEKYIFNPIEKRISLRLETMQDWLKDNSLDIIGLIAIVIITSIGLKMFLYHKKEKDGTIIYTTIVCYTVIRLFWRVIFHV